MLRRLLVLAVAGIAAPAFAQSQLKELPPGLTTPSDDVIRRRFDDRNLCSEPRKTTGGCNEVRDGGDASFWIKRVNGDILQMRPQ